MQSLAVVGVLLLHAASANAKPLLVRVESRGCIDDSGLTSALAKYRRRSNDSDDLLLHVVELEPGRAHLEVIQDQTVVAERELSPLRGTCQEQTDALALAASIAIDALLQERSERKPALPTPAKKTAPVAEKTAISAQKGGRSRRSWLGFAGAGVGAQQIGSAFRAELGVTWQALPPLLLGGRALTELGRSQNVGSGSVAWQRWGGSAGGGVRLVGARALKLDFLVEALVVLQVVRGQHFAAPLTQHRAEAGLSTSLRLSPAWRFAPYIEPGLTLWARPQLADAAAPDETRAFGRVAFRLLLGVACCDGG